VDDRAGPAARRQRCRAKVNLSLCVPHRRADGWHELESLVAFAACADSLTLEAGTGWAISVEGPGALLLGEKLDDNLVLVAARALAARVPALRCGHFHLVKNLPVAAGLGGGSADAAAALRLLALTNGLASDDPRLLAAAAATGADVPVCLLSQARTIRGRGELLGPRLRLPALFAVLVNPGVPTPTSQVFATLGLKPAEAARFSRPMLPLTDHDLASQTALIHWLRRMANDLEDAACVVTPVIGDVLAVLSAARGCRLARMSGSGATCFALFDDRHKAGRAAKVIRRDHRDWWVRATLLR
jgi:4-diphosphocytidyl-2-C-methyl-D-erythritol kinase